MQSSTEQILEPYHGWRHSGRYPEDQDLWECMMMNFAKQVNFLLEGALLTREDVDFTLTKAHTHISTLVMGMQEPEKKRLNLRPSGWRNGKAFNL